MNLQFPLAYDYFDPLLASLLIFNHCKPIFRVIVDCFQAFCKNIRLQYSVSARFNSFFIEEIAKSLLLFLWLNNFDCNWCRLKFFSAQKIFLVSKTLPINRQVAPKSKKKKLSERDCRSTLYEKMVSHFPLSRLYLSSIDSTSTSVIYTESIVAVNKMTNMEY